MHDAASEPNTRVCVAMRAPDEHDPRGAVAPPGVVRSSGCRDAVTRRCSGRSTPRAEASTHGGLVLAMAPRMRGTQRRARTPWWLLGAVIGVLGCEGVGVRPPTEVSQGGSDVGVEVECLPPVPEREPSAGPIAGVLHLEGAADAMNLSLDGGARARLDVMGCDTCGRWTMRWSVEGDDTVLRPREGALSFDWFLPGDYIGRVHEVRLSRRADGRIDAAVSGTEGQATQVWAEGRVCAKCCRSLGPSGLFRCEGQLPLEPCYQDLMWSCRDDCAFALAE